MKLTRHTDATVLNEIVNDPSIYKWAHGQVQGPLDLSPLVANPFNYLLMGKHGGVFFFCHQPGLYEAHTQVLPEGRGPWALDMVKSALEYMFTRTEAIEIVTRVPKGNLAARALTRAIHGEFQFRNKYGWTVDNQLVYADVFNLTIQRWLQTAEGLTEKGEWFHNKLEKEMAAFGRPEPQHEHDRVHDRYVGAAVAMLQGGQPQKAVVFYNRWAVMAGYALIRILTERPLVLDISNALLSVKNGDFRVLCLSEPESQPPHQSAVH